MRRVALALPLLLCLPLAAGNAYGKLPLSFEPNQGQTDSRVRFLARVPGYALYVTPDAAVFAGRDGSVERMKLVGANHKMRVEPVDKQPGISNYFIGNDPSKWRTNIPNYGRFALRDVYPGIDLIFYGKDQKLEYDWVIAPGADPKQIRVKWEHTPREDSDGDLTLSGGLRQKKPLIRQDGKTIDGGYVVCGKQVGFKVGKYDAAKPLIIDPVLLYSTYLGGSGVDFGSAIAVDSLGSAYVTGYTGSLDFPTAMPIQATSHGRNDVFVTKINPAGSALVYSTYLGGSLDDYGNGVAVDEAGNSYVTGYTYSANFPTINALQATFAGGLLGGASGPNYAFDAFVTKINPAGSALVYSTYLGGNAADGSSTGGDSGQGIAVDAGGNAYVTGFTGSPNFPTANALQAGFGGGFTGDAFVTKINASGTAFIYSTYLGGSGDDTGLGIAVDGAGDAYVTGGTQSTNFPTFNPLQGTNKGNFNAFVTKINPAGSALVYSTYLGGSGSDGAAAIAVDGSGNAYITGSADSHDFPIVNPFQAFLAGPFGDSDAFVTKINAAGSALVYSTYLGGNSIDAGTAIAVDPAGSAYVTGYTFSSNFPTNNPLQANFCCSAVFVTKFDDTGSALLFSTYLGANNGDTNNNGYGIAVDNSGNAYVAGLTVALTFPTANPLQASNGGGGGDAFVSVISSNAPVGVFRDATGAIELTSELTSSLSNSGGDFAGDPAVAQNANGDTFVVARDSSNALWVNVYDARTRLWDGWASAGGAVQGIPAVAAIGNTAFIVARDPSNAYWSGLFTRGVGFGGWVNRGGAFATDPAIGASPLGILYVVGKDNFNAIWVATSLFPTFGAWQLEGAVASGKPSVTENEDGVGFIAIRDPSNAVWMGRYDGVTFDGWQPGGGAVASDPQVAAAGGLVYVAALTSNGGVWYNTFTEGINNWTGWQSPGGVLMDVAAAAGSGPQLFLTGRDGSNQLWWYETPGAGWKFVGAEGLAAGPLYAAPR
jgi:hypothetical protein